MAWKFFLTHLPTLALMLAIFAAPGTAGAVLFEQPAIDLQAEVKAAAAEGKRLAVFLTMPDCPGCSEMERSVFGDRKLESRVGGQFRHVRLNILQPDNIIDPAGQSVSAADFARRLRAVATPSFAFFDGKGQTLYRYTGLLDVAGLDKLARFVQREEYEQRPFDPPAIKARDNQRNEPEEHASSSHHGNH